MASEAKQRDAGLDVFVFEIRSGIFIVTETLVESKFEPLKHREAFSLVN